MDLSVGTRLESRIRPGSVSTLLACAGTLPSTVDSPAEAPVCAPVQPSTLTRPHLKPEPKPGVRSMMWLLIPFSDYTEKWKVRQ